MFWKRFNPLMVVVAIMVIALTISIVAVTWRHNDWALQITLAVLQLCGLLTTFIIARGSDQTSKQALQAAIESNKLDRELHLAETRPWVVVTRVLPNSDVDLSNGLQLSLEFEVANVGKSIASHVNLSAGIYVIGMDSPEDIAARWQQEMLSTHPILVKNNVGQLLIPNEKKIVSKSSFAISKADIENGWNDSVRELVRLQGMVVMVYGAVTYGLAGADATYVTGFRFQLLQTIPPTFTNPRGLVGVWPDEKIPVQNVVYAQFPSGNFVN